MSWTTPMPDQAPPPARVYGAPMGYQPPDPNRKQRAATPATDPQVAKAYQAYMKQAIVDAHNRFKQQMSQPGQAPKQRGSASRGSPKSPALLDAEIERQSK